MTLPGAVDVAIVGSGYTGLLAALQTARAGRSTLVLDAEDAGWGCSTRNGGQISTSLKPGLDELTAKHGKERAFAILRQGHEALAFIGDFIARARQKPWFDDTVFLIVADHCASSAGKSDLPLNRYHIPALIYSPKHVAPAEFDRLASQMDLAPTLLGLLRFRYTSRFLGYDLFDLQPGRERAFIGTYQDLGFLRGERLVKLDARHGAQLLQQVVGHRHAQKRA